MSLIDNIFDTLAEARNFSKIDMTAGYIQVCIAAENIYKTVSVRAMVHLSEESWIYL